ncbi:MAG: hypothetical protein Hals2KO_14920 [Halioglobus sp.]
MGNTKELAEDFRLRNGEQNEPNSFTKNSKKLAELGISIETALQVDSINHKLTTGSTPYKDGIIPSIVTAMSEYPAESIQKSLGLSNQRSIWALANEKRPISDGIFDAPTFSPHAIIVGNKPFMGLIYDIGLVFTLDYLVSILFRIMKPINQIPLNASIRRSIHYRKIVFELASTIFSSVCHDEFVDFPLSPMQSGDESAAQTIVASRSFFTAYHDNFVLERCDNLVDDQFYEEHVGGLSWLKERVASYSRSMAENSTPISSRFQEKLLHRLKLHCLCFKADIPAFASTVDHNFESLESQSQSDAEYAKALSALGSLYMLEACYRIPFLVFPRHKGVFSSERDWHAIDLEMCYLADKPSPKRRINAFIGGLRANREQFHTSKRLEDAIRLNRNLSIVFSDTFDVISRSCRYAIEKEEGRIAQRAVQVFSFNHFPDR